MIEDYLVSMTSSNKIDLLCELFFRLYDSAKCVTFLIIDDDYLCKGQYPCSRNNNHNNNSPPTYTGTTNHSSDPELCFHELRDGGVTVSNFFKIPIIDQENVIGIVCIVEPSIHISKIELTPYIKLAQLVVSNIAHNDIVLSNLINSLRTPMNGAVGMMQLLVKRRIPADCVEYVETINESVKQLALIMSDIHDYTLLNSDKVSVENSTFKTKELLNKIAKNSIEILKRKHATLNFNIGETVPEYLDSDMGKIEQIMYNLIKNSVEASSSNSVITVRLWIENKQLFGQVIDSGYGILESERYKLFKSFMRLKSHNCTDGARLGLYICHKLITLLKGNIQVEDSSPSGTTVTFSIPFTKTNKT